MKKFLILISLSLLVLGLVACGSDEEPTATTAPASSSIYGVEWQWESVTNQTTGETTTVPNPANYTITFNEDGTFEGQADCNAISGTYTQDGGSFTITVGPSTLAFCGEESLDTVYVGLLGTIVAGGPDGAGGLALETAGGEQRMRFIQ